MIDTQKQKNSAYEVSALAGSGQLPLFDSIFSEFKKDRTPAFLITLFLKRLMDISGSLFGLMLFFPLFLGVSIAIKMDSEGPVLFRQARLGLYGKPFKIYKFRTMCQNAEYMTTGLYSFAGDSRVTKIGTWLRHRSIDELAQLINVLSGSMSLVGPRPPVIYELGDFNTLNCRYKNRFRVKPGMTGLAQIVGRNSNTWDDKVDLDNQYIEKLQQQSVWIDIVILFKTIKYVFEHNDIVETKVDNSMDDALAAEIAEREIIRRAHEAED